MRPASLKNGLTLTELLVAIGILSMLVIGVSAFQRDVFSLNSNIQGSLNAQLSARAALREFTAEVREASPSSLGAYPIVEAGTSSFAFYSDTDDDGERERIRYYMQNNVLRKGITRLSGGTYNTANEETRLIINDVHNGSSTPLFTYYNGSYAGSGAALAAPFPIYDVRLVKLTLMLDDDPNRSPDPFVLTTQVTIRNLKDNL